MKVITGIFVLLSIIIMILWLAFLFTGSANTLGWAIGLSALEALIYFLFLKDLSDD